MRYLSCPFALLAILAPPAAALEPSGMIIGTFGDQTFELAVLIEESGYGPADDAQSIALCSVASEVLYSLCIGIKGEDLVSGPFTGARVSVFPDVLNPRWAFLSDDSLPLQFSTINSVAEGGLLHVEGNVTGELARIDVVNGGLDMSQTLAVKLRFDAVLGPAIEE